MSPFFGGESSEALEQRMVRGTVYVYSHMRNERAILDSYGNISRGQIVKILSQLQTAVASGDFSGATNSRRSRAKESSSGAAAGVMDWQWP